MGLEIMAEGTELLGAALEAGDDGDMDRMLEILETVSSDWNEDLDMFAKEILVLSADSTSRSCGLWFPTVHLLKAFCEALDEDDTEEKQWYRDAVKAWYANALAHSGDVEQAEQILRSILETTDLRGSVNVCTHYLEVIVTWREELTAPE